MLLLLLPPPLLSSSPTSCCPFLVGVFQGQPEWIHELHRLYIYNAGLIVHQHDRCVLCVRVAARQVCAVCACSNMPGVCCVCYVCVLCVCMCVCVCVCVCARTSMTGVCEWVVTPSAGTLTTHLPPYSLFCQPA